MILWRALSRAVTGWMLILRGDQSWREQFNLTWAGLGTSVVIFLFMAFLAIAMASTYQGMPGAFGILDALLAQCLWIAAVYLAIWLTAFAIKSDIRKRDLLIPAIYLLVFYLAIGSILNLAAPLAVLLLTLLLLWPFYQLGRIVAGWPVPNAAIFAVMTLVLLVGMPQALYMLSNFAGPST